MLNKFLEAPDPLGFGFGFRVFGSGFVFRVLGLGPKTPSPPP